jgi:glucosamine--fructose-6-phosphate aminotransferase (isomerizing)
MCGIIGYIGIKDVQPILLKGLRRLEYRGYDSAGLAMYTDTGIVRVRATGKVDNLASKVADINGSFQSTMGIAHTRWATHGGVTEQNAHPHVSVDGKLTIVHNGIIENYREIKAALDTSLESETDTEILAHLIGAQYRGDLREAVETALVHVRGTYGIVVMHTEHPDTLIGARMGSPLVVGIAEDGYYIASDATPLLPYTKRVMYLDDGEVVELSRGSLQTFTLDDTAVVKHEEEIAWSDEEAEKNGYDSYMLKEIHDQPRVLEDAMRGRYNMSEGTAHLGGLNMTEDEMRSIDRIILIACGTASYAALAGKYAFERLAGIPVEVEVASEFRYRDPIVTSTTLVFGVSQSGETADTIAALREAKRKGAFVRGIVNVIGSTIARETDGGTYIHAGPELSVASTKAYTNMVTVLTLYALQFGRLKRVTPATGQRLLTALQELPAKIQQILDQKEYIKHVAQAYTQYSHFFYIGRGVNYPVALEGSLKLKEITYIHSEAYPGGELKHGPIALLDEQFPVFAIMTQNQLYEKMRSNVEEIRARKAPVILIATEGDTTAAELADHVITVPKTMELLEPILNATVVQLFAYFVATDLGRNVDRPRNLAKSVTVE